MHLGRSGIILGGIIHFALLPGRRIDKSHQRHRHERRHQCHDDHHGKERTGKNAERQADVEDDQFHQPAGIHEDAQQRALPPGNAVPARGEGYAAEFSRHRNRDNDSADQPKRRR